MTFTYADFQPPSGYDAGLVEGRGGGVGVADCGGFRLWREGGIVHASDDGLQSPLALAILRRRLSTRFPTAPTTPKVGIFTDERVAFDDAGDAYTLAEVEGRHFVLRSVDRGATWHARPLPVSQYARIEFNDTPTRRPQHPPAVLLFDKPGALGLLLPEIDRCGRLDVRDPVPVADDSLLEPNHSGAGNCMTSIGDGLVALVYPSRIKPANGRGTSIRFAVVSRRLGRVLRLDTLVQTDGSPDQSPDPHDIPVILQDSTPGRGLHVIYCGHHTDLWYIRSLSAGYARWSDPVRIGMPKAEGGGGHTYVSAVIDADDQIHIVTRFAGDTRGQGPGGGNYYFTLSYNRLNADGTWSDQQLLVSPGRFGYGRWGQRLSIDNSSGGGRLILTGELYAGDIRSRDEYEIYSKLYPGALKDTPDGKGVIRYQPTQRSGGAFILQSTDGGDLWTPATAREL